MATKVDICNAALSLLGDTATVTSIDPPEGSDQADHCARFYPLALNQILSTYQWSFAIKRVVPAKLAGTPVGFTEGTALAYAVPSDCLRVLEVQYKDKNPIARVPHYNIENIGGVRVIITDQKDIWLKYISSQVDEALFPPAFTTALQYLLAALLTGPLIPGSSGIAVAKDHMQMYEYYLARAKTLDARQQRNKLQFRNPFIGDFEQGGDDVFH